MGSPRYVYDVWNESYPPILKSNKMHVSLLDSSTEAYNRKATYLFASNPVYTMFLFLPRVSPAEM
jgi:hypothetical protein